MKMIYSHVLKSKMKDSWETIIKIEDETVFYAFYDTEEEGLKARHRFLLSLCAELNRLFD